MVSECPCSQLSLWGLCALPCSGLTFLPLFGPVNHYKCPLCDMTCPLPSSLRNHIRFRHSEERPFKCDYCDYR